MKWKFKIEFFIYNKNYQSLGITISTLNNMFEFHYNDGTYKEERCKIELRLIFAKINFIFYINKSNNESNSL